MYEMTPRFAESCECGPLSLAVIRHDVLEVSRILGRSPDSLTERDIYGQSPIHLAAAKPRVLSLLVEAANIELLRLRDYSGFDVLDMAMAYSSWQCVNGFSPDRCRQCSCTECVTILFKAGCSVRTHEPIDEDHSRSQLNEVLGGASELARRRYIFQMKVMRAAQSRALASHNGVRERHTDCRYSTIWTEPYVAASIGMPDTCDGKSGEEDWSWVYCKGGDPHLGDLFYRHGFQPHPSLFTLLPSIKWMNLSVTYMCWLAEHGVDLFLRSTQHTVTDSSSTVGLFGAHFAFYHAYWNIDVTTDTEDLAILLKHYEAVEIRGLTDGCHCACTIGGCSPFIWTSKKQLDPDCGLGSAAEHLASKYQIYNTVLTKLTYAAAIRFATFEALGLKHTCCEPGDILYVGELHDANDVGVMNEEQAKHLELHEELVAEFEEKAREFLERRTDNGTDFPNFWSSYWIDRIQEVLESLDGDELTDEERRGAEEIGVSRADGIPGHCDSWLPPVLMGLESCHRSVIFQPPLHL
ncbi:hypothetical protein PFICI_11591 [Pestalotiopsis fici W106-1]|uniref:Uncharacterized protein n=1 Tax=Pestalotiopsis fici (strain W106-1 / CGMCC3.15140) TaxID=1229662 RepID=W3WQU9_PESFW|nr:uncharacterized protein PFICI_11591 [Pestalotiopsis fici W106-1]ETS76204.1 hypothetical protein PFICI_11591 [Pestalotiopsis fici W106-1]